MGKSSPTWVVVVIIVVGIYVVKVEMEVIMTVVGTSEITVEVVV